MKNNGFVAHRTSALLVLLALAAACAGCAGPAPSKDGDVGSASEAVAWQDIYACWDPGETTCDAAAGAAVTACLTPCTDQACVDGCVVEYNAVVANCAAERELCVDTLSAAP